MQHSNFKPLLVSLIVIMLLSTAMLQQRTTKLYLIGDSTMSVKEVNKYPETGWGMPFANFFDEGLQVENHAKNGRSTKTFLSEGRWQKVLENLQEGDWVFIQFGHNDESVEKKERYTTPEEYRANLLRYINETRAKKANPLLLTPVSRRRFDAQGKALETHAVYSQLVRELAREQQVPLIDMDKKSQELLQQWGPEKSRLLFLQLAEGEHPNYPKGVDDNTHFNELGARLMAQLVLAEMKALNLPLTAHIVKPATK